MATDEGDCQGEEEKEEEEEEVEEEAAAVVYCCKKENPKMDLERCSGSCCSSSSSCSDCCKKGGGDVMVKIELDAARALADFAELALLERERPRGGGGESSRRWGSKGRRSTKRVKNESAGRDGWVSNIDRSSSSSGVVVQSGLVEDQQHEKMLKNMTLKPVKSEEDSEFSRPIHMCPRDYMPHGGGKLKQNLTEVEKEARRLRRVLANRESARQTIRRRQAMCEELTRKAADLAWDNESMKREKELIMKEYQLLKDKNTHLKEQMAFKVKSEIKEEAEEIIPSIYITTPKSPSDQPATAFEKSQPVLLYPRSTFRPHVWPSIIHHLNSVHPKSIPLNASNLQDPITIAFKPTSSNQPENHLSTNVPRIPYYILPYPWFFPLSDQLNVSNSSSLKPEQSSVRVDNLTESNSTDNVPENYSSHHPNRTIVMPTPVRSFKPDSKLKFENKVQLNLTNLKEEPTSPTASHVVTAISENDIPRLSICTGKKLVDAAAAAEARKRRKELTRLKNLNRRQFR